MSATNRRRRRTAAPATDRATSRVVVLDRTAKLVRAELRRRRTDLAPAAALSPTIGVTEATLREAVARDPQLGICGPPEAAMVWSLPPGPVAAGFEPRHVDGRLVLVLPARDGDDDSLMLSGRHLGPIGGESDELGGPGRGELGNTIARLYLMADRWLLLDQSPENAAARARGLFELVVRTWRSRCGQQWASHRLEVYQVDHGRPIATRFWADGARTRLLELVVWTDDEDQRHLVNVYPGGTHRAVVGQEV